MDLEQTRRKFKVMLQKQDCFQIFDYLEELRKKDPLAYFFFYKLINDNISLLDISKDKISLANFLAKSSNVEIIADDRMRVVFLLAATSNKTLEQANLMFKKEFGPYFTIRDHYSVNGKSVSWKVLADRAKEIKRGTWNIFYIVAKPQMDETYEYFENLKLTNTVQLQDLKLLGDDILADLDGKTFTSPSNPEMKEIVEKVKQFYSASGRLKLDIDKLEEEPSFENIARFIMIISLCCEAKIEQAKELRSSNDSEWVKKYFLDFYSRRIFENVISIEEVDRMHKPLDQLK